MYCNLRIEQACKICMKSLVPANQLIAKSQPWHEATLLQPENGTKTAVDRQDVLIGHVGVSCKM